MDKNDSHPEQILQDFERLASTESRIPADSGASSSSSDVYKRSRSELKSPHPPPLHLPLPSSSSSPPPKNVNLLSDGISKDRLSGRIGEEDATVRPYHMRTVRVHELTTEGHLGILLAGTQVRGFHCTQAKASGWQLDDQIVGVNQRFVQSFSEFAHAFNDARSEGFPIDFRVLRREPTWDLEDGLPDIFENVRWQDVREGMGSFSMKRTKGYVSKTTNVVPCSDYWRTDPETMEEMSLEDIPHSSRRQCWKFAQLIKEDLIEESNAPVQALIHRRMEYATGLDDTMDSLAIRLGTQRVDALASFASEPIVKEQRIQLQDFHQRSDCDSKIRCCKKLEVIQEESAAPNGEPLWACCRTSKVSEDLQEF